jgi:hypothetical protein
VAADDGNFQESTVADIMRDWKQWTLAAGKAKVTFNSYMLAPMPKAPMNACLTWINIRRWPSRTRRCLEENSHA